MAGTLENRSYVYQHTFSDGSLYIGKGTGRRSIEMQKSRRGDHWNNAAKKYGRPKVSYLKENISEDLAFFIEEEVISLLKDRGLKLRNIANGGGFPQLGMIGPLSHNWGKKKTAEQIERLREISIGEKNPHYGRHHSEQAKVAIGKAALRSWANNREAMAAINVGRKLTEEHKKKISNASKAMSKESREVIRQQLIGKKRTPEQIENYKAGALKRSAPTEITRASMSENQWRKDHSVYTFEHISGTVFAGTRAEMKKETEINVDELFRNGKRKAKTSKGWRIKESE